MDNSNQMYFAQSYTIDLATVMRLSDIQLASGKSRSVIVREAIELYHAKFFAEEKAVSDGKQ